MRGRTAEEWRVVPSEIKDKQRSANVGTDDESVRMLVVSIARALVDDIDDVNVELHTENGIATIKLVVAPADTGKVIGKQGRTARSIRTIMSAVSMKYQRRYCLDIDGPHNQ
jgi:predicted RNA-binding protein YlqC (UPF0109 family)